MKLFDISDQVILVTGGAGLLGEPICRALAHSGANVVVADIDEESGSALADELERGTFRRLDITDLESISTVCDSVTSEFERIDGLVNTAYPRNQNYGQPFESVELKDWIENINMHLGGYYAITRAVILRMLQAEVSGSIINFASIYGLQAPDFSVYEGTEMTSPVEYSAIKGAVLNFSRYLASYFGSDGIRVNSISPGGVFDEQDDQFVKRYNQRVPLGRMAQPEDIVGAVLFLLSNAAAYVTGHNLVVDGGWSIK